VPATTDSFGIPLMEGAVSTDVPDVVGDAAPVAAPLALPASSELQALNAASIAMRKAPIEGRTAVAIHVSSVKMFTGHGNTTGSR